MGTITEMQLPLPTGLYQQSSLEPLDCSTPALDLCIRKRPRTPTTTNNTYNHQDKDGYFQPDTPTSTIMLSPASEASSDSTSDISSLPGTYLKVKATRPFKAYPKNPLSLALGVATAETLFGRDSAEAYAEFRKQMLSTAQHNYSSINKNMRRPIASTNSNQNADPAYWEKRRKNNEAAKRSRDARRAKEDEIAIRCAFLEQENLKLKYEITTLREEIERYRTYVYQCKNT